MTQSNSDQCRLIWKTAIRLSVGLKVFYTPAVRIRSCETVLYKNAELAN